MWKSPNSQQLSRDIALLLKAEISHQEVVDAIQAAGVKRLTDIKLFDVFSGEKLGLGMKSMAYSLTFQNPEDSLTDEEVARYMEKNPSITRRKSECGSTLTHQSILRGGFLVSKGQFRRKKRQLRRKTPIQSLLSYTKSITGTL